MEIKSEEIISSLRDYCEKHICNECSIFYLCKKYLSSEPNFWNTPKPIIKTFKTTVKTPFTINDCTFLELLENSEIIEIEEVEEEFF